MYIKIFGLIAFSVRLCYNTNIKMVEQTEYRKENRIMEEKLSKQELRKLEREKEEQERVDRKKREIVYKKMIAAQKENLKQDSTVYLC